MRRNLVWVETTEDKINKKYQLLTIGYIVGNNLIQSRFIQNVILYVLRILYVFLHSSATYILKYHGMLQTKITKCLRLRV